VNIDILLYCPLFVWLGHLVSFRIVFYIRQIPGSNLGREMETQIFHSLLRYLK
jgi:hypothetical protein